jgi:prepilin-type N-terminal cleavage/methylation domain-containing protein
MNPSFSMRNQAAAPGRGVHWGFTLIELILVMTILTIAVSITAPRLANFFRGRALDSEARRLLALTRQGQSRAASEGLPMELWIDAAQSSCGLEAEPSYDSVDPKAISFAIDKGVRVEIKEATATAQANAGFNSAAGSGATAAVLSNHPKLPRIRFLPDGSVADTSPQAVQLIGSDDTTITVSLSRSRLNYEIRNGNK